MLAYFDSSAFVKLVVDEPGTEVTSEVWDASDAVLSSRLAHVEVVAALHASHRNRDLTRRQLGTALTTWAEFWAAVRVVELSTQVADSAATLAGQHGLRGADAVHLASALAVGENVVMVGWDRRLHAAADAAGLRVAPSSTGPIRD